VQILITRPRADAEALARALEDRGHRVLLAPVLTIEPIRDLLPGLDRVQAIVLTSANAVPALAGIAPRRPVFAVGAATARAARAAGWADVRAAAGDAPALARLIIGQCRPAAGPLLHLSGAKIRPGLAEALAAAGLELRRQAVYRAVAAESLPPTVVEAIRSRALDAVLLFSPRSAAVFADLIAGRDLAACLDRTAAVCLSAAVAAACARLNWAALRVAARPELAALLRQLEGRV
jgi:uroporphyrinogen-III synthase